MAASDPEHPVNSISSFIARIGESPSFVAFMAHSWFAFGVLAILAHFGVPLWATVPVAIALAAWKEFWFDLRYEQHPPQTLADSALDFAGYMAGVGLALCIFGL